MYSYVDIEAYEGIILEDLTEEEKLRYLTIASRHIDTLTFNRIRSIGFEQLTEFQRKIIQEVVCLQADFEYENRDIFELILSGYSINGVSMQFGNSWNVDVHKGIPIRKDVYQYLMQTGLCCLRMR